MHGQKVAIIGAGIGGLAAALFLHRSGHHVTLFEKFDQPKPLGAGLLLQPTGLSVLALLGLDKKIIQKSSKIERLYGRVAGSTSMTLDVNYNRLAPHLFGLGVQRNHLFFLLYEEVLASDIPIHSANEIESVEMGDTAKLVTGSGDSFGPYDLVIDASGAKSHLRESYAEVKLDKPYPFGALWAMVTLPEGVFKPTVLEQRYKNAYHMIGVMPAGEGKAAFFWSMRVRDYDSWKASNFGAWKDYVQSLWPDTAPLLAQFATHNDLAFATYNDVILKQFYTGPLVFIGDSAHCTSPQLGQGANLALMDAWVLSECLRGVATIAEALRCYEKERRKHVKFYQMASRVLTPFFQSDSLFFARLRFLTCGLACRIAFTQKIAAHVLTGTKTGLFSSLNPGEWAKEYDIYGPS